MVAKSIANLRFEPVLKYGASVSRVAYDMSAVRVRSVSRGSASTIDAVTDSAELLTINIEREAVFHISDGEVTQAGPLNPGEVIGGQIAIKVAVDLDKRFFNEVTNASYTFDTGDLTTLASSGVPFAESSTNTPIMVAMMPAKLRRNNQTLTNLCFVTDSYGAGLMTQYLLGKNIDLVASVYANGYAGDVAGAQLYVSENLTGTADLALATTPTNADTVTINGIVWTFVTTIGATPGNVLIGGSAANSRINLAAAINSPGTTDANKVALSAANQVLVTDTYGLTATDVPASTKVTVRGMGSGAMTVSETLTAVADVWSKNCVHAFFGKKGAVDMVVQDLKEVDMRETSDRRGTNVFSSYLAGIKTFTDGSKKFLDVLLAR